MVPDRRLISAFARTALLLLLVLTASSCSTSLFKVKPADRINAMPANAAAVNVGTATFRAAPLLTDEETQELFEANLQLAGLLPVRLEVTHNGGDPLEIKKLRFQLRDDTNGEWKLISAKQAISRILKANGVSLYNPNFRKTFEKEFRAYEFDTRTPLTQEERRRSGFIIFLAPEKNPVNSPRGLVFSVQGLPQPVSLKLN